MQLILDDQNVADTHATMATLDESLKEKANGVSEEVNECNGNKENVDNINSKDVLCEELEATTDVALPEPSKSAKDLLDEDNNMQKDNDISSFDAKIIGNNEIKEKNLDNKIAPVEGAEICDSATDILEENSQNDKQTEYPETPDRKCSNEIIENGSYLEHESSIGKESERGETDVDKTNQNEINGDSCEEMDIDKNASIEEVSDKTKTESEIKTDLNIMPTESIATCQEMHSQVDEIQEDSPDVTMVEEASPVDSEGKETNAASALGENIEDIVTQIMDKETSVVPLESIVETKNVVSHTDVETSNLIIENMSSFDSNHTEKKIPEPERALENVNEIALENTDLASSIMEHVIEKEVEPKENDNNQINSLSSDVEITNHADTGREPESAKFVNNAEGVKNAAKIDDSMEVIEDINQSHENGKDPIIEDTNISSKEMQEVTEETKLVTENKDTSAIEKCSKTLEDSESKLDGVNIKTVSESIENDECKESSNVVPIVEGLTENNKVTSIKDENLKTTNEPIPTIKKPIRTSRLSNTLDILSDDEDDNKRNYPEPISPETSKKQCINLDDDDDVLLVDDIDSNCKSEIKEVQLSETMAVVATNEQSPEKQDDEKSSIDNNKTETPNVADVPITEKCNSPIVAEKMEEVKTKEKPFIPENFLKTCKKSVAEMTREELEEFCVLRIVESVLDKSSLNDIKTKLKTMSQNIEEYKKKAMYLTKQNRDLQVVLKSVQEELKKNTNTPITPLKITRSVGMQVLMVDKGLRKKATPQVQQTNINSNTPTKIRTTNNNRPQNVVPNQTIPVPRLVPAQNVQKTNTQVTNQKITPVNNGPNNAKKTSVTTKVAEKRPRTSSQSVTVDLTDDEPPAKANRNAVNPVRLVNQQSLMASRPNTPQGSSPRKVFIPISPQSQPVRPGQAIMLRPPAPVNNTAIRGPNATRMRLPNSVRVMRMNNYRHPAPLPDHVKQYQPPNWKALPPAPDLKLSKVENGIVISWKIDGYLEDLYEEIASYQLYAYQETSVAPSTSLWKKIGDVKALPLPMACTLTQFMTGYKYYFAVRAVDIRSRVGPFSLPGSILLLNKV